MRKPFGQALAEAALKAACEAMHEGLVKLFGGWRAIVVVGGQWGDEGKGKIVDVLMLVAQVAARFGGGANAGHTVKVGRYEMGLHQVPSAAFHGKPCVLGRGTFPDLLALLPEIRGVKKMLKSLHKPFPKIYVDTGAHMTTVYHKIVEHDLETVRSRRGERINTTMKGMGPTAATRDMKIGVTVGDAANPALLSEKLQLMVDTLTPLLQRSGLPIPPIKEVVGDLTRAYRELCEMVQFCDTGFVLRRIRDAGGVILGEGAQAAGLDPVLGTYPYVTTGRAVSGGMQSELGCPVQPSTAVLVVKPLPTRVGGGPFITEIWNRRLAQEFPRVHPELFEDGLARNDFLAFTLNRINRKEASPAEFAQYVMVRCRERGVTSGRGRSPGYLDLPWLNYSLAVNGAKFIALTHLDALSGLKRIPVVTAYEFRGRVLRRGEMVSTDEFDQVVPRFEYWLGWKRDITGVTQEEDLPKAARLFLRRLERRLNAYIPIVGTGPAREHLIIRLPAAV